MGSNAKAKKSAPVLAGMGALVAKDGVGFRVWGAAAERVEVIGEFNDWKGQDLQAESDGYWYGFVPKARAGQEYLYRLTTGDTTVTRIDPYARLLTHSAGNAVIYDPGAFDWEGDERLTIERQRMVIYEMHMGTFAGSFEQAAERLRYLEALGVNAVELMPVTDFPGELSWGYNPAHMFAVETNYGGPDGLKTFVKEAHRRGIAVILDVVYNHMGPDDLSLWNFDGTDPDRGGPFFYNDHRANTPWGDTRPNYDTPAVRQMIRDNARMWLEEYHVDGIRSDGTVYIRRDRGAQEEGCDIPEGWSLLQWINDELHGMEPPAFTVAEDLQSNDWLTKPTAEGGAGFDAQWDPRAGCALRDLLASPDDEARSPGRVAELLVSDFNGDPFQSVRFTENHDEVANGKARVPQEIDPESPDSFWARARSCLGAFLILSTPGIPMIFQGQERFDAGWFRDDQPIDWSTRGRDRDLLHLYRDLMVLRTGRDTGAPGLSGNGLEVVGLHEEEGWLAFRRFQHGAEGYGCLVLAQLKAQAREVRLENVPDGTWVCRFASGPALHREVDEPQPTLCKGGVFTAPLAGYSLSVYALEG